MRISPLVLEEAPTSRVLEWLHFWNEQQLVDTYRAEEQAWRMTQQMKVH